jgi:hypothetical protein
VKGYRLHHRGTVLLVEAPAAGPARTARLLVDGVEVDRGDCRYLGACVLRHGDTQVEVGWNAANRVRSCAVLLPPDVDFVDGAARHAARRLPMDPPEGTMAARLAAFQREHPAVYASRHVVVAAGQVLFAGLGLGLALRFLLPRIDLGFLSSFSIDMPDLPRPDLALRSIPLPDVSLPEVSVPEWLVNAWRAVRESTMYWVPILVALGVARSEYRRRRALERERSAVEHTAPPNGDPDRDPPSDPGRDGDGRTDEDGGRRGANGGEDGRPGAS